MTADERRWAVWLVTFIGSFGILEGKAIKQRAARAAEGKPSGTLTASIRKWGGVSEKRRRRHAFAAFMAGLCFYLYTHLVHGWFDF